jgi:glycosyltransferase involved in cell wall biosynthesis
VRILFSLDNYDHGTGGAERSARTLAHQLAARGHQLAVLQRGDAPPCDDGPVRVHTHPIAQSRWWRDADLDTRRWNRLWRGPLGELVSDNPADLIVTQGRLLPATVEVAAGLGVPVVAFVRGFAPFCPDHFRSRDALTECDRDCRRCLPLRLRLKLGAVRRTLDAYERAVRQADLVLANSRYMQAVVGRFHGIEARVVYPAIDLARYRVERPDAGRVLFCKARYAKGLPVFCDIARRLPATRFLVTGRVRWRARRRLARLPNAECVGRVGDMREAYRRARVLLGPSIWPEPFGRVFVEAAASGIPSVASARGGIPEAVGDGGMLIRDVFDPDAWADALGRLDDPATYAALSAKALDHAGRFAAEVTLAQFLDSVESGLGFRL